MKIYTFKKGDTLENIAKENGVSPDLVIEVTEDCKRPPAQGEELLILTPTRTHRVCAGDSLERIVLRYGVNASDLIMQNPRIAAEGLCEGKDIVLKYDQRPYGSSPTNGYVYKDYDEGRLRRALPYLTYVTVSSALALEGGIKPIFKDAERVKELLSRSKIPLLRIYDALPERDYSSAAQGDKFINDIIYTASGRGYMGVVLSSEGAKARPDDFGEFILRLRKAMIGCDLILITEVDEDIPGYICELADGNVFSYPKYLSSPETNFNDGEAKKYTDYAKDAESAKTFIDIPCLARIGGDFITAEDAVTLARMNNAEIITDPETLISKFNDKTRGECRFQGLGSIKKSFDLIEELNFMGASFDVSRTPLAYLLMYNALFKSLTQPRVRTAEGCSEG